MAEISSFINKIIQGDAVEILKQIPNESVDCIITSPPYYGLRDYGEETQMVWGGDNNCAHEWQEDKMTLIHENRNFQKGTQEEVHGKEGTTYIKKFDDKKMGFCSKCGAWRGQLGLEPTPELYVEHLMEVFRECKRVLKKSGTFWLNLGDTYSGSHCGFGDYRSKNKRSLSIPEIYGSAKKPQSKLNIQPKCLLMIPERIAFALINDGWLLRNKICWFKANAMPSSVKDRFSNKWEYFYFFTKSRKYYFDLDAVREPHSSPEDVSRRIIPDKLAGVTPFKKGSLEARHIEKIDYQGYFARGKYYPNQMAYRKELWEERGLDTSYQFSKEKRYQDKFNGFGSQAEQFGSPRARTQRRLIVKDKGLTEIENLHGWSEEQGRRIQVGLRKIDETAKFFIQKGSGGNVNLPGEHPFGKNPSDVFEYSSKYKNADYGQTLQGFIRTQSIAKERHRSREDAKGLFPNNPKKQQEYINFIHDHLGHPEGKNPGDFWEICTQPFPEAHFAVFPEELCVKPIKAGCPEGGIVLDPFCGSGTALLVARKLNRNYIGIDLKEEYCEMARKRLAKLPERLEKWIEPAEAEREMEASG